MAAVLKAVTDENRKSNFVAKSMHIQNEKIVENHEDKSNGIDVFML